MSRYQAEEARNEALCAKLDDLFAIVTDRLLEAVSKSGCKPIWIALAIRWAAYNGIKVTAGKRTALNAMQSLRDSVDQMGALSAPFGSAGEDLKIGPLPIMNKKDKDKK